MKEYNKDYIKTLGMGIVAVTGIAMFSTFTAGSIKFAKCQKDPICMEELETKYLEREIKLVEQKRVADSIRDEKLAKQKRHNDSLRTVLLKYRDENGTEQEF